MGDVGENTTEEVNFLKAGTNVTGPPVDYGWPQREGTNPSGISGTTGATVNPFTGVTALEPVWQFPRSGAAAAIGGYSYRGPVAELQGKYFYSNFVGTGQAWMLEFDRNTNPASFNGANGTNTDVNALWQSLVFDFNDPTYSPESTTASSAGVDHIVSFGEDNSGNLYIVDFGNGSGFNGQYPGAGLGEIFRVVPIVQMKASIDRVTGEMTFSNESAPLATSAVTACNRPPAASIRMSSRRSPTAWIMAPTATARSIPRMPGRSRRRPGITCNSRKLRRRRGESLRRREFCAQPG